MIFDSQFLCNKILSIEIMLNEIRPVVLKEKELATCEEEILIAQFRFFGLSKFWSTDKKEEFFMNELPQV